MRVPGSNPGGKKKVGSLETDLDASIIYINKIELKSSQHNKISFRVVIENILTLGVRVPGSNPGGSKKVGSWKLIWMLQLFILTKLN